MYDWFFFLCKRNPNLVLAVFFTLFTGVDGIWSHFFYSGVIWGRMAPYVLIGIADVFCRIGTFVYSLHAWGMGAIPFY